MEDIRIEQHFSSKLEDIGYIQLKRNTNYSFTWKNGKISHSFVYTQKGALRFNFFSKKEPTTITIPQDTGIFIPKELPYKVTYLQESTKVKILTFNIESNNRVSQKPIPIYNPEQTLIFATISKQNAYDPFFLSSKVYELFSLLLSTNDSISNKYKRLCPALLELKQQYFKNQKISYYADLCSMSEPNFRKLFKEYTGLSPITYRNHIRISALQTIINTGEASLSEAAFLVGFNNISYFYQVYRKYKSSIKCEL